MTTASEYGITVRQEMVDGERLFVATVQELEHVLFLAETATEAYAGAQDIVEGLMEAAEEENRDFPKPKGSVVVDDDFSGRVTLRMPRSLHRMLAREADQESVSLNQLMLTKLALISNLSDSTRAPQVAAPWVVAGGFRATTYYHEPVLLPDSNEIVVSQEGVSALLADLRN